MIDSDLVIVAALAALFVMIMAIADLIRLIIERRDRPCVEQPPSLSRALSRWRSHDYPFFAYSGEVIIYDRKHLDELEEVLHG